MITHPEKVLFPDDGITKGELAAYYEAIAPIMLPHICGPADHDGAVSGGIGEEGFFQKDVSKGFPAWLERVEVPKKGGTVHYPLVSRHAIAALAREPEQHHAARVDVTRAATCISRTSASSISIRPKTSREVLRAAALGAARSVGGARSARAG